MRKRERNASRVGVVRGRLMELIRHPTFGPVAIIWPGPTEFHGVFPVLVPDALLADAKQLILRRVAVDIRFDCAPGWYENLLAVRLVLVSIAADGSHD